MNKETIINNQLLTKCLQNIKRRNEGIYPEQISGFYKDVPEPLWLSKQDTITDSNSLKKDAFIIVDAFESVTNGMENPEAFTALQEIGHNSPYREWKSLILLIKSFYLENKFALPENISNNSLLLPLLPILEALTNQNPSKLSDKQNFFYHKIIHKDSFFKDSLSEMKEAQKNGLFDVFITNAFALISELYQIEPLKGNQLIMWVMNQLLENNISPTDMITGLKTLLSKSEVYRVTAITVMEQDPPLSLIFWIQSILQLLVSEKLPTRKVLVQYLIIMQEISQKSESFLMEEDSDLDYHESLFNIVLNLRDQLIHFFPEIDLTFMPPDGFKIIYNITALIPECSPFRFSKSTAYVRKAKNNNPQPNNSGPTKNKRMTNTVQLELF